MRWVHREADGFSKRATLLLVGVLLFALSGSAFSDEPFAQSSADASAEISDDASGAASGQIPTVLPAQASVVASDTEQRRTVRKVVFLADSAINAERTNAILAGFSQHNDTLEQPLQYLVVKTTNLTSEHGPMMAEPSDLLTELEEIGRIDVLIATWLDGIDYALKNFPNKLIINISPRFVDAPGRVINLVDDIEERVIRTVQLLERVPDRSQRSWIITGDLSRNGPVVRSLTTHLKRAGFSDVRYLEQRDPDALVAAAESIPEQDSVFYLPLSVLEDGRRAVAADVSERIGNASRAPMFSLWRAFIGHGAVGGYVFDPVRAGEQAWKAIHDLTASGVFTTTADYSASHLVIDQTALDNLGVGPEAIVGDVTWLNPPKGLFSQAQIIRLLPVFLAGLAAILVLAFFLVRERRQRLKIAGVNRALKEAEKKSEQAFLESERSLAKLQQVSKKRDEVFGIVAHELRTPVAAIAMMASEDSPEEFEEHREQVVRIVGDLLNTIDDMRLLVDPDYKRPVRMSPFRVAELNDEVERTVASVRSNIGVELAVDCRGVDGWFVSDTYRIRVALANLLKNAFLHAQATLVTLKVRLRQVDGASFLEWSIIDDGQGISSDLADRLFEPFERGNTRADGSGLGLHIARSWMVKLGGRLEHVPTPNGCEFRVTVPAITPPSTDIPEQVDDNAALARTAINGMRVLIVEDEPTLRMMARKMLTKLGADVDVATDGVDALAQDIDDYPLILTDYFMPEMDGVAFTRALRARGYEGAVVGVTAASIGRQQDELTAAGADLVVYKPLTSASLLWVVGQLLQRGQLQPMKHDNAK